MEIFLEHNLDKFSREDWDGLSSRGPTSTIFQTFVWHKAWLEIFGNDQPVFLIRVMHEGKLSGIAPLIVSPKGRLRVLKFIGQGHSDYCDFLYPSDQPEILDSMLRFLQTRKDLWDAMALDSIPEGSSTSLKLPEFCRREKWHAYLYSRQSCPKITLELDPEFLTTLMQKKNFQRDYKQLIKQGDFEASHLTKADQIDQHLEVFFQQHISRRQGKSSGSLFLLEKNKQFYRALVRHMEGLDTLLLTVIMVDQKAVAYHFGWTYGGTLLFYKPSFDPDWSKHSPGDALLMELFRYCREHRIKVFDFSTGNESYKSRYANAKTNNISFKIFRSSVLQRISWIKDLCKGFLRS